MKIWPTNQEKVENGESSPLERNWFFDFYFFHAILFKFMKVIYIPSFNSFGSILWFLQAFVFITIFRLPQKSLEKSYVWPGNFDRVNLAVYHNRLSNSGKNPTGERGHLRDIFFLRKTIFSLFWTSTSFVWKWFSIFKTTFCLWLI